MKMRVPQVPSPANPKNQLAAARASVAALLEKPATQEELDKCLGALDEIIVAVRRIPELTRLDQDDAVRIITMSLTDIRGVIKRRPR